MPETFQDVNCYGVEVRNATQLVPPSHSPCRYQKLTGGQGWQLSPFLRTSPTTWWIGRSSIPSNTSITRCNLLISRAWCRLQADLASYAQPVFIRIVPALTYTTTFKHKKTEMRDEGFSLSKIGSSSAVYVRDPQAQVWVCSKNNSVDDPLFVDLCSAHS